MAQSVIWSEESLQDIDSIAEYISRDSIHYAQRVVDEIFTIMETIQTQPEMGRVVPEIGQPHVREHFIYSYRIIYEIQGDQIYVLAVIHGGRLLKREILKKQ